MDPDRILSAIPAERVSHELNTNSYARWLSIDRVNRLPPTEAEVRNELLTLWAPDAPCPWPSNPLGSCPGPGIW